MKTPGQFSAKLNTLRPKPIQHNQDLLRKTGLKAALTVYSGVSTKKPNDRLAF